MFKFKKNVIPLVNFHILNLIFLIFLDTTVFSRPSVVNKRPPPPLLAAPHILALRQKSKDM